MPFLNRPQPAQILFLALFTSTAGNLVLTPILPDVARDLGVSTATAGGLRIASGVAGGVVALTVGVAGRRLGLRDLIAAGLLLIGLGSVTGAAALTFAVLAASQLAVGAGNGLVLSGSRGGAREANSHAWIGRWQKPRSPASSLPTVARCLRKRWVSAALRPLLLIVLRGSDEQ